jgi:hypothetical protein
MTAVVLTGGACDEKLTSIAGPTPGLEPTFSSISREIFQNSDAAGRTACVACHTDVGHFPAGGLVLLPDVAYGNLVGAASFLKRGAVRVVPGQPDNSYLIQKLAGAPGIFGARMPLNGPPYLTPGQIQIIRRWIELGAPND